MKTLLALALVAAACSSTPLEVPDWGVPDLDGRWATEWAYAGTDDQGDYSTRYVFEFTEDAAGWCTAILSCECTRPEHAPENPGTRYWEGNRSQTALSMQSSNLVTGDTGSLTATVGSTTVTVRFSWGETLVFARVAD